MVSWREQFSQNYSRVVQEEIRYPSQQLMGRLSYDYSEFITTTEHANLVGRYALSSRARITHQINFSTYLDAEGNIARQAGTNEHHQRHHGITKRGAFSLPFLSSSSIAEPNGNAD